MDVHEPTLREKSQAAVAAITADFLRQKEAQIEAEKSWLKRNDDSLPAPARETIGYGIPCQRCGGPDSKFYGGDVQRDLCAKCRPLYP